MKSPTFTILWIFISASLRASISTLDLGHFADRISFVNSSAYGAARTGTARSEMSPAPLYCMYMGGAVS